MLKKFAISQISKKIIKVNNIEIRATIADTPTTRDKGLMYVSYLPENEGCLLKFDYDQRIGLWMKNCKIPMQVAFIDKFGTIVDIQNMDVDNGAKVYYSSSLCLYALEMNAGFFDKIGVKINDKIVGIE